MKARDVMSRPVVSIGPDTSIRQAITLLTGKGFAAVPVVDEAGQVVGIFSESDAIRATMRTAKTPANGRDRRDEPVSTAMTAPVEVVAPGTDLSAVAEHMLAGRFRCLPVVHEGLVVGVVARRDLLRTLIRTDDVIAANVRALLDGYARGRRRWRVEVDDGRVIVAGGFADEAERAVVAALTRTASGVTQVELRPTSGITPDWDD